MAHNLTEEEINILAVRAAAGDDAAMSELVGIITPSAKARAEKFDSESSRISEEDLTQEGMLGFLEAVKKYDISKGVPFTAFACVCIKRQIISALRKNADLGNIALSTAVSIEDNDNRLSQSDPGSQVISEDESARIYSLINSELSDFEKDVVILRLAGASYDETAKKLGCTAKSVDNAVQRIRKKIRTKI